MFNISKGGTDRRYDYPEHCARKSNKEMITNLLVETGYWEHNLLCGSTIFTDTEGKRYEEVWKDGARIGARKPLKRDGCYPCEIMIQKC
jgi:hypothetical protein